MESDTANILVTDDLPEKLLVYQSILEELGQNLIFARNGAEALKHVLHHEFAVILLDVNMPGMDGFETAALIRKRRRSVHTPIIFITAFTDEVRAVEGYAHGAVDYILAPVVPQILRAKVKVFVDLFRMTQQVKRQAEERIALAEERTRRAAAELSNRNLDFLAKAGGLLGQSLDHEVTAHDVARLPVPFLAQFAAVVLADGPAGSWKGSLAWADGDNVLVEDFSSHDAGVGQSGNPSHLRLPPELSEAVGRVLSGGSAEEFPTPAPTSLVLPLVARARTFGALGLSAGTSGQPFGLTEQSLAEALASRAAVALDNAQLYQSVRQADRQKNEFLSMLAHELRNPLAPIRNAVHVLQARGSAHPELVWARDVIDRQVAHMTRLVDDLLDVSRITRGKIRLALEPVEMSAVVAQALEVSRPLLEARRHRLEVSVPPDPLWVNGDVARLAQVMTNLLNNAAKYTEEGGWVRLTVGREGEDVVVRVRDTGIGILPEMLSSIFELFTQVDRSLDRSEGGLGIGLTLAQRLVEMHDGKLLATSDGPGRGSEFIVRLRALTVAASGPLAGPAEARPPGEPPAATAVGKTARGCQILVVDDNVDSAVSLAMLLRLAGHEVRVAHDGPAALEIVQAFRPAVIVLDIGLPGMDGYEIARRLRNQPVGKNALLIAVTGYGQEEDRRRSFQAGFNHHLVKPVDLVELRSLLVAAPSKGEDLSCGGKPISHAAGFADLSS